MRHRLARLILIPLMVGIALQVPLSAQAATTPQHPRHYLSQVSFDANSFSFGRPHTTLPGNFPFQTVKSADGLIAVHYYGLSLAFAQQTVAQIAGYIQHPVKDTLGYGLKSIANIYLYDSRADFLQGTSSANSPEIGAFTLPATSSIYMPVFEDGVNVVSFYLPHELTHLVFHQNNDSGHVKDEINFYPLWLDEGLAASDELPGDGGVQQLEDALATFPYQNIFAIFVNDYPTDANVDLTCYAYARTFILYLEMHYGMARFHQFILDLHDGDYNLAMEEAFGADMQTIRSNWQQSVGQGALKHDGGLPLLTPVAAAPYQHGTLNDAITQTTLYPIDGQARFFGAALSFGIVSVILALLAVGGGWLQTFVQRRRQRIATAGTDASPTMQRFTSPYAPYGTVQPDGFAASDMYPSARYALPDTQPTQVITAERHKSLPRYPFIAFIVTALSVPIVVGIETAWPALAPSVDWSQPYQIAALVASLFGAALLGLGIFALTRGRFNVAHGGGVLVAIILVILAVAQSHTVGLAQGNAYEQSNDLALARQLDAQAGASGATLARIDARWASEAFSFGDDAMAITHWRNALEEDTASSQASVWRTQLTQATDAFGKALIAAQQYSRAEAAYHTQAQSGTCDATCSTVMQEGGGQALVTWAENLLAHNQTSEALTELQLATSRYGHSAGGKSAARVLAAQSAPLAGAFSAASAGDDTAMSILALLVARQQPHTANAIQASEISVIVTGAVSEGSPEVNPKGDTIFFAGFTNKTSPEAWLDGKTTDDPSVVKIIATIGDGGKFTALLPPGYWYVPFWDDISLATTGYINASQASDRSTFYVNSFVPLNIGTLDGY